MPEFVRKCDTKVNTLFQRTFDVKAINKITVEGGLLQLLLFVKDENLIWKKAPPNKDRSSILIMKKMKPILEISV